MKKNTLLTILATLSITFLLASCGGGRTNRPGATNVPDLDYDPSEYEMGDDFEIGDEVVVNWHMQEWYTAEILGGCEFGFYKVMFYDDIDGCHPANQITLDVDPAIDSLDTSSSIIAKVEDDKYLEAEITSVNDNSVDVELSNGDTMSEVSLGDIRAISKY